MYVQGQEAVVVRCGVSADQKVSENAARAEVAMLSTPVRIAPEGVAGRSPHIFAELPINRNSRVVKKCANEIFGASGSGDQFGENRGGHDEISALEGGFERGTSGSCRLRVLVPQGNNNIGVDRGGHLQVNRWTNALVVVTAHLAQPAVDGFLAGGDAGIANARVLGEYVLVANGADMHSVAVTLEE